VKRCILYFFKDMILRHCVTKWRHSIRILTDLESTHRGLSYEVVHDMVPSISKFDFGIHNFHSISALTMKVSADRHPKLSSYVVHHMLLVHQVWSWSNQEYSKTRFLLSLIFGQILIFTFNLDPGHLVWWLLSPWY
jgi:hypothetical protein